MTATASTSPAASPLRLLWHLFRYQNRIFLRNPFSAFFSLAFPVMFLLLFGMLFGSETDEAGVAVIQFIVPSMIVFAVVATTYMNLSVVVSMNRDEGILKRVRGTPVPAVHYLSARILSSVWWALVAVAIQIGVGMLVFGVEVIWRMFPAMLLTLLLGIACFAALGMALAAVIPNGEAAPAISNATALPLLFVSGVFIPLEDAPSWVTGIGNMFPIRHFWLALVDTFNPYFEGSGFAWGHLAIVALWTVVGVAVAVWKFRWEPRPGSD